MLTLSKAHFQPGLVNPVARFVNDFSDSTGIVLFIASLDPRVIS